jgi:hypothetical protein
MQPGEFAGVAPNQAGVAGGFTLSALGSFGRLPAGSFRGEGGSGLFTFADHCSDSLSDFGAHIPILTCLRLLSMSLHTEEGPTRR